MKKLLIALLMVPAMARAEFLTGNELYQKMTSTDHGDRMYAMGFVVGAYDIGVHVFFCPRTEQGITVGQVQDIVRNYMAANPGQRNRTAEFMVREAFKEIWPCANRTPGRGA